MWLNGIDLTDTIESFRFESDVKKGDLVEFKCKSDKAVDLANNKNLVAGAKIEYQYGFIGGVHSSLRLARLGNIEVNYDNKRVQLTIRATDKGIEIKKGGNNRAWHNVTLSDVAKEIAEGYGLTAQVIETSKRYNSLMQVSVSDWEFLNSLVLREAGAYHLHIEDTRLILEKNVRDRQARRLFTLGENIISFRTSLKEISQKPQAITENHVGGGINDKTGKTVFENDYIDKYGFMYQNGAVQSKEIQRGVREWESKDGRFSVDKIKMLEVRNGKKSVLSEKLVTSKVETRAFVDQNGNIIHKDVYTPYDKAESGAVANNLNEEKKQKVLTGELKVELDPIFRARDIVTLSLPVDSHSGNWFVEKVTHSVDKGGAFTELSLNKNGVSVSVKSDKDKHEKVNTTTGETSNRQTSKVRYSGVSGLEVQGGVEKPTLKTNNFNQ